MVDKPTEQGSLMLKPQTSCNPESSTSHAKPTEEELEARYFEQLRRRQCHGCGESIELY